MQTKRIVSFVPSFARGADGPATFTLRAYACARAGEAQPLWAAQLAVASESLDPDAWEILNDGGDVFASREEHTAAGIRPAPLPTRPRYNRAALDAQIDAIHTRVMSGEGLAEVLNTLEDCAA